MRELLLLAVFTTGCMEPDRYASDGFCATGAKPAKRRMLGFIVEGPPPSSPGQRQEALRVMFQEAKNAIRAEKYLDAQRLLNSIADEDPAFGGGTVAQYSERVDQEQLNQVHLRAAQALASSDPAAAAQELERVGSDTPPGL